MLKFENTYRDQLSKTFYSDQNPVPVSEPVVVILNKELINELKLDTSFLHADYLSGNKTVVESTPIAQAYAGHQFGHFNMLGDGRAILLGETITKTSRFDIQLKGSGQTKYSRRGDGRATLYSMLREYLISEAMYFLGIPSTRSLSVVSFDDKIYRETPSKGGVLTRVAQSHIRVGTFEYARALNSIDELNALTNYTIERHFPELVNTENKALKLLETVMDLQIDLIVNWMRVGFIHGVMNTDNMSIPGETIDYGPCAFMNSYHPGTVFSSIDKDGRYAYGNQPHIGHWNLVVFANSLLPIIDKDTQTATSKAQEVLDAFPKNYEKKYTAMMFSKLGIANHVPEDETLIKEILQLLSKHQVDYTNFFTALRSQDFNGSPLNTDDEFIEWLKKWNVAHHRKGSAEEGLQLMKDNNPVVTPRNHLVEKALTEAASGDMSSFNNLLKTLTKPYDTSLENQSVPKGFDEQYYTFCGT